MKRGAAGADGRQEGARHQQPERARAQCVGALPAGVGRIISGIFLRCIRLALRRRDAIRKQSEVLGLAA